MYAIISDGGRQYKVEEGQELKIDFRPRSVGDKLTFESVLAVGGGNDGLTLGAPVVSGAKVSAEVVAITQGEKLEVQKFRRRKTLRRRTGHRQVYTQVRIDKITR